MRATTWMAPHAHVSTRPEYLMPARGGSVSDDRVGGLVVAAEEEEMRPAWRDEDDDDVEVDIANKDRLRKLRRTEEEEKISGVEYEARLRAR